MKLIIVAIALLAVAACTAPTGKIISQSAEQKLCAILPMSGAWGLYGEEMGRGLQIAVDDANAARRFGERPIKLVIEDDAYEKKKTVTAAQKLIGIDACKIIDVPFIETASPIVSIAESERVPLLVMLDSTSQVYPTSPYLFSSGFSTERTGALMAQYAYTQRGARSAVVVLDQIEWPLLIGESFAQEFTRLGGSAEIFMLEEGDDFRQMVALIEDRRPDAVYFAMTVNSPDVFVRRLKEQNVDALLLTGDSFSDDFIAAAAEAAEGVCKTDVPFTETSGQKEVLKRYEGANNKKPTVPQFVLLGYESGNVALRAMQSGPDAAHSLAAIEDQPSIFGGSLNLTRGQMRTESLFCVAQGRAVAVE